jgi:hypothetical protein
MRSQLAKLNSQFTCVIATRTSEKTSSETSFEKSTPLTSAPNVGWSSFTRINLYGSLCGISATFPFFWTSCQQSNRQRLFCGGPGVLILETNLSTPLKYGNNPRHSAEFPRDDLPKSSHGLDKKNTFRHTFGIRVWHQIEFVPVSGRRHHFGKVTPQACKLEKAAAPTVSAQKAMSEGESNFAIENDIWYVTNCRPDSIRMPEAHRTPDALKMPSQDVSLILIHCLL